MSTEFVTHQPPPGEAMKHYNRSKPPNHQAPAIPQAFLDAMYVREEVFVKEQNVPLENEIDDEDPLCHQWIAYASVGAPRGQEAQPQVGFSVPGSKASPPPMTRQRSASTATRLPVGVIRLVPPHYKDYSPAQSPISSGEYPTPTAFPGEPYIRLGRLATLKDYRGLGLSKLLVNAAMQYAKNNAKDFELHLSPANYEERRQQGLPPLEPWKGLVYVHAQKERTVELWKRWGFVADEGMGTWDEEGMDHVGMWKRLELPVSS